MRKTAALLTAVLVVAAAVGLTAGAAVADDATVAWSVSPATADGKLDARSRVELQLDPGAGVHDQVLVANASTVEQTFRVYGADAFNTADGGYDLQPGATTPQDVGAWITFAAPTVTIPPLASAVVGFDVAVPAGASPGDHAGGIVVSQAAPSTGGVVVDSRVALRLAVRVTGELAPALEVRSVTASYSGTVKPFAPGRATVRYTLVNTGNVKVVGKPRLRVSGPFGLGRVDVAPGNTQEVLPGESFVVESQLDSILPFVAMTATADVAMSAAPGPDTEIPLVSSTGHTLFFAPPWALLLVLALAAVAVVVVLRRRRARRREGEALWHEMVAEAGRSGTPGALVGPGDAAAGAGVRHQAVGVVALLLLVGAGVAAAPPDPVVEAGSLTLSVPPATVPPAAPVAPPATAAHVPGQETAVTGSHDALTQPPPAAGGDGAPVAGPTPTAQAVAADQVWRARHGLSPAQWALVVLGAGAAVVAGGLALRPLVRRQAAGVRP
ncbi:DUF916 domain-containing protein [Cellulomonas sp. URHD0024]|uniref:DUF916 domain-containing protein n=1 Tax=Cellulomonas sp. URHD0024 TaxID=1302620 RepID=UPI00041AAFB5|nr:DUF916 domain-containing protein [Cellulomonas sp. URHD0024]